MKVIMNNAIYLLSMLVSNIFVIERVREAVYVIYLEVEEKVC